MGWNKISEKGNPSKQYDYLIFTSEGNQYVASYYKVWENKNHWKWRICCECCDAEDCLLTEDMITHWMELPNDPNDK